MNGILFLDKVILTELTLESDPDYYEKASFEKVHPAHTASASGEKGGKISPC